MTVHLEHCAGCSDPLCRVIRGAEVTSNRDEVTCKVCRKIFDLKPVKCVTSQSSNRTQSTEDTSSARRAGLARKKK